MSSIKQKYGLKHSFVSHLICCYQFASQFTETDATGVFSHAHHSLNALSQFGNSCVTFLIAFYLFLLSCNIYNSPENLCTEIEVGEMVKLSIDFQNGFKFDTVILHLNGKEVYHKKSVCTKLLLGLADSFKTVVEKGPVSIYISVVTRNMTKTILLEVSADTYLGVSILGDRIEHIISNEKFGYG